jgi:hypothetical protein
MIFLLTAIGVSLLLVAYWADSQYDERIINLSSGLRVRNGMFEYRPEGWPLETRPRWLLAISLHGLAGEWVSHESCPILIKETRFYYRSDVSSRNKQGIAYRERFLHIKAPVVPILAAMFLVYPIIAFLRGPWRRDSRLLKGLCRACGYNLTGNVSGVCSECGVECAGDDARRVIAKRRRNRTAVFFVSL